MEQVDVVVVGGRLAGCAAAPPLARAGRRVVVLDRMRFPSDQLSTHLLMPAGTSELAKLGALPRILALNPSQVRYTQVEAEGIACRDRDRECLPASHFANADARVESQSPALCELVRDAGDLRTEIEIRLERRADRFHGKRTVTGSEHPGAAWPAPPTGRAAAGLAVPAPDRELTEVPA